MSICVQIYLGTRTKGGIGKENRESWEHQFYPVEVVIHHKYKKEGTLMQNDLALLRINYPLADEKSGVKS